MATQYEHGLIFVCPAALVPTVLGALDSIMPRADGQPRDSQNPEEIGMPLSANGNDPATHYLSHFMVTESTRAELEDAGLGSLPGVSYWRVTNPGGVLATTNHAGSAANIGQPFGWTQALTALGLQKVESGAP
jgi:hypothetical protein